jgi:hypothetical protein
MPMHGERSQSPSSFVMARLRELSPTLPMPATMRKPVMACRLASGSLGSSKSPAAPTARRPRPLANSPHPRRTAGTAAEQTSQPTL